MTSYILTIRNYPRLDTYDNNWILLGGLTSDGATFRIRRSNDGKNDKISSRRFVVARDALFNNLVYDKLLSPSGGVDGSSSVTNDDDQSNETDDHKFDGLSPYVTSVTVSGLQSSTQYFYATWDDNEQVIQQGKFRTAPLIAGEGQGETNSSAGFKFATSGCSWSGSTHGVYSTIYNEEDDILFFLHLG